MSNITESDSVWWWIVDKLYLQKDHPAITSGMLEQFKDYPQLTKVELEELLKKVNTAPPIRRGCVQDLTDDK